jgi:hypothetical protein
MEKLYILKFYSNIKIIFFLEEIIVYYIIIKTLNY